MLAKSQYSPGGYSVFHTEVDIVCDAIRYAINVLPMGLAEYHPCSHVEAIAIVIAEGATYTATVRTCENSLGR